MPQNNLMVCSNGFTTSKKLVGATWQTFSGANNFAEFSNGSIIGSAGSFPDTVYSFSVSGVKGAKLGNYKFKLSPKYCNGTNNRLFVFAYGVGMAYIDYSNLGVLNFPATLDGVAMTESSWANKSVIDMIQTSNGNLYAVDNLGYGIFKSTDNGVNWITVYTQPSESYITITKKTNDELFILAGYAEVRKSSDGGVTWTNISGNLPPTSAFKVQLFVNSSNELFCLINNNGSVNASNSGIYKLTTVNSINDISTNNTMKIYPNPNNGTFTLVSTNVGEMLIITDLAGKQVYSTTLISVTQQIGVELNAGIYLVKVGNNKIQKLIIE
ncbi:MAG: T9SS type A sorting domain-containing protein [Bacteroidia bacterium]|nr:T9SS type A sorting domain-containing protein [Bacteroidia bacterium]